LFVSRERVRERKQNRSRILPPGNPRGRRDKQPETGVEPTIVLLLAAMDFMKVLDQTVREM
jgi:hypothetical protein